MNPVSTSGRHSFRPSAFAVASFSLAAGLWYSQGAEPATPPQPKPAPKPPASGEAAPAAASGPLLRVRGYEITGNTLLPLATLDSIFEKYVGTNIGISDIKKALSELQMSYRNRGYVTVQATLPPQQVTNELVRIKVIEGTVAQIMVVNNKHFSSNNVVRALPSLKTNAILNGSVFQAELDRANANRDRQIYPQLRPGPEPNTTAVELKVKDRLPLHGKIELNNQRTPNTPRLRMNSTLTYNNLWQLEHSAGLQYGFTPENMKAGGVNFYDKPLIANYSAFYRLPLVAPESLAERIVENPTKFGYNEVTRRFELPPSSGVSELNLYASRSSVDTGVTPGPLNVIAQGNPDVSQQDFSRDDTTTENVGIRFSQPLPDFSGIRSVMSVGMDFKRYRAYSYKTNVFTTTSHLLDINNIPYDQVLTAASPVPTTFRDVDYLTLSLRWDASRSDAKGNTSLGVGINQNIGPSLLSDKKSYQNLTGTSKSSGYFTVANLSLSREQMLPKGYSILGRLDGQYASQPLISNEQFGIGGTMGVRGYREGEQYGDHGWRASIEPRSPAINLGMVDSRFPMLLRGSAFMDYGESYLAEPNGRKGRTPMLGTGLGATLNIGYGLDLRTSIAWALKSTSHVSAGTHFIYISLSGQF